MSEVPPRAGVVASLHAILAFEIRHSADERAFAWSLPLSRPLLYMLSIITAPGRALRAAEGARGPTTRPRPGEAEPSEGVPKLLNVRDRYFCFTATKSCVMLKYASTCTPHASPALKSSRQQLSWKISSAWRRPSECSSQQSTHKAHKQASSSIWAFQMRTVLRPMCPTDGPMARGARGDIPGNTVPRPRVHQYYSS